MEVHQHSPTARKKFTHYLFEFFMLFLAVFCGFLAEDVREHRVEKERERIFIKSFYQDLTADERDLQTIIDNLGKEANRADSLFLSLSIADITTPANLIYMDLRGITRSSATNLYVNDRTIVQLRNSGGMRLIQNKNVSDSIVDYYKEVETIQFLNQESITIKRSLREKCQTILKGTYFAKTIDSTNQVINPAEILYLRSTDANAINGCLFDINNIRGLSGGLKGRIIKLRNRAGNIKKFIAAEYHI
jgi:hypothetical protein